MALATGSFAMRLAGHARARPVFALACCAGPAAGSGSGSASSGSGGTSLVEGRLSGHARGRNVFAFGRTCAGSAGSGSASSGSGGGGLSEGNYLSRLEGHARGRNVWAVGLCGGTGRRGSLGSAGSAGSGSSGYGSVGSGAYGSLSGSSGGPECCPELSYGSAYGSDGGASGSSGSGSLARVCADIYSVGYGGSGAGSGPSGYGVAGGELLARVCLERLSAGEFSGSFFWGGVLYQLSLLCADGGRGAEGWIMQVNGERAGQAAPGSTCNPFNIIFSLLVIAGVGLANIRITSDDSCCQPGSAGSSGYGSASYGSQASGGTSGGGGGDSCETATEVIADSVYSVSSPGPGELWWRFNGGAGSWHITVDTTETTGGTENYTILQGTCASLSDIQSFTIGGPTPVHTCFPFTASPGDVWIRFTNFVGTPVAATFTISTGNCPP